MFTRIPDRRATFGKEREMIQVITISREYGSGGASIAKILGERLGWRLIDALLIAEVARSARATPETVRAYEENVDPWFHRIMKALWRGDVYRTVHGCSRMGM